MMAGNGVDGAVIDSHVDQFDSVMGVGCGRGRVAGVIGELDM